MTSEEKQLFALLDTYARAEHRCFLAEMTRLENKGEYLLCFRPSSDFVGAIDRYACRYLRVSFADASSLSRANTLTPAFKATLDAELRMMGVKCQLYTVVLDCKGGTYISQVTAASPGDAVKRWVSEINDADLTQWGITRKRLAKIAESDSVVALDGCINAWCVSGSTRDGLALVNIIATARSGQSP